MTTSYHAASLTADELAQALPLIQVTWPEVGLQAWRDFARSVVAGGGGVLALREQSGYICGLLAYRRDSSLGGPVLLVSLFTVADLANRPGLANDFLGAVEGLARRLGCVGVRFQLDARQPRLTSQLRRLGLSSDLFLLRLRCD